MILCFTMQGTGDRGNSLDSVRIQNTQLTSRRLLPGRKQCRGVLLNPKRVRSCTGDGVRPTIA